MQKMKPIHAILTLSISVPGMISAQAEEIPDRGPIPFAAYDLNSDGKITESEFSSVREKRQATRPPTARPMPAPSFSAFDRNGDGWLSADELTTGQQEMQQRRRAGMGSAQGAGMGRGMGRGRNRPTFADFDLNSDGSIPEAEFLEAQAKRISERSRAGYPMRNIGNLPLFTDIDTNQDGLITADEFSAHQLQHRRR